jgi:hypothetical protein
VPWAKEDDERLRAFVAQGVSDVRTHAREIGCPFPSLRVERQADEIRR